MKSIQNQCHGTDHQSRPARGAWIEIWLLTKAKVELIVAPRTGRVD